MKNSRLKTLLITMATLAASIPAAFAQQLPVTQKNPYVPNFNPFVCNIYNPGVDGFAGYINIAGFPGLTFDLETINNGNTSPGIYTSTTKFNEYHPRDRFTNLEFNLQGYCNNDGCSGPWIYIQGIDNHGNFVFGTAGVGQAQLCPGGGSGDSSFTHYSLSAADFGLVNPTSVNSIIFQLYPGFDGSHDTRIRQITIGGQPNGMKLQQTLNNFCPQGFQDFRPTPCFNSGYGNPQDVQP